MLNVISSTHSNAAFFTREDKTALLVETSSPLRASHLDNIRSRFIGKGREEIQPELLLLELGRIAQNGMEPSFSEKLSLLNIVDCLPHTDRKILGPYSNRNTPAVLQELEDRCARYLKPVTGDNVHGGNGVVRTVKENTDRYTISTIEGSLNREEFCTALTDYFSQYCGKMWTNSFAIEREISIPLWEDSVWELRFVVGYDGRTLGSVLIGDYAKVNSGACSNLAQGGVAVSSMEVLEGVVESKAVKFRAECAEAAYKAGQDLALSATGLLRNAISREIEKLVGTTPPPHLVGPHRVAVDIVYQWGGDRLTPLIMELQYPGAGLSGLETICPAAACKFEASLSESRKDSMAKVQEWISSVLPHLRTSR